MTEPPRYIAGGTLPPDSEIYQERDADAQLLDHCLNGRFAYVLTSRQMGKSSLMARTARRLIERGIVPAIVDLTSIGAQNVTAEQWYLGVLTQIESYCELDTDLFDWWRTHPDLPPAQRFSRFLSDVLAHESPAPVVIFVDEIDSTLSLNYTDDFFAAIRALHNARAIRPELMRISFVLLGVATPSELIKDATRTPFNIGHRVELADFTVEQVQNLLLALPLQDAPATARRIHHWSGGQPYLTLRLCGLLAAAPGDANQLDALVSKVFLAPQVRGDPHFQFISQYLASAPAHIKREVFEIAQRCIRGERVRQQDASVAQNRLRLSGLVREQAGELVLRNELYRHIFDARWIRETRPTFWTDRNQRRALWAAAVIFALIAGLLGMQSWQLAKARTRADAKAAEAQQQRLKAEIAGAQAEAARALAERAYKLADRKSILLSETVSLLNLAKDREAKLRAEADQLRDKAVEAWKIARANERENYILAMNATAWRLSKQGAEELSNRFSIADLTPALQVIAGYRMGNHDLSGLPNALTNIGLQSGPWRPIEAKESTAIAFTPDDRQLIVGMADGRLRIVDATDGKLLSTLGAPGRAVRAIGVSPDGNSLAIGDAGGAIRLWDAHTGAAIGPAFDGHVRAITALAFTPDGARLVSGSEDSTLRIWDAGGEHAAAVALKGHNAAVRAIAISADGRRIVSASADKTLRLWNAVTGEPVGAPLTGHTEAVTGVSFSPDGRTIVSAGADGTLRSWDAADGHALRKPLKDDGEAFLPDVTDRRVLFLPNSHTVLSADGASGLQSWDMSSDEGKLRRLSYRGASALVADAAGERVALIENGIPIVYALHEDALSMQFAAGDQRYHARSIRAAAFNPDGKTLVSGDATGTLLSWDAHTGLPESDPLPAHDKGLSGVSFSRDGHRMATIGGDGQMKLWDPATHRLVLALTVAPNAGLSSLVSLNPDGHEATTSDSRTARVWDLSSGSAVGAPFEAHTTTITALTYLPDGRDIVSADFNGEVIRWEAATGRIRWRVTPTEDQVHSVAVSPDGNRVAVGAGGICSKGGCRVFVLNTASGQQARPPLVGNRNLVIGLAFDPTGRYLASGASDGTVIFWEFDAGRMIGSFDQTGLSLDSRALAFSPDGKLIATGTESRRVKVWLAPDGWIPALCAKVERNLSDDEWRNIVGTKIQYVEQCPGKPHGPKAVAATASKPSP